MKALKPFLGIALTRALTRVLTGVLGGALLCCATANPAPAQNAAGSARASAPSSDQQLPSPPATATVKLHGQTITIHYNTPSIRGRKIFGGLVPYDHWWRTGANPATTLVTPVALQIGKLDVPAGTYTLYTLPSQRDAWMFIVNKQTGQWGTIYHQDQDLGRTPMEQNALAMPQETMSLSFANTHADQTQLHMKWEKLDEFVTITAK